MNVSRSKGEESLKDIERFFPIFKIYFMEQTRDCACCGGEAELDTEEREMGYRKEKFVIQFLFYKCEKCGEQFTTNETDSLSVEQVYSQYRENHKTNQL